MRKYILAFVIAATTFLSTKIHAQVDTNDSLILIDLYNNTAGANWTTKWDLNQPVSTWYGVSLYSTKVVSININGNNLAGTIPSSIGQLDKLLSLQLFENHLTGTIPSSISDLENMQYLELYSNSLTGSIPSLEKMSLLQVLNLSGNQLSGNLPAFGQSGIIDNIDLSFNQLTGNIPSSVIQLDNLRILRLINNRLSGTLPPSVAQMKGLQLLLLSHNMFSGSIPASFDSASNIAYLTLDSNRFSGNIPPSLGKMPVLQGLALNANKLSGTIPPELGQLQSLFTLDLGNNHLSGGIPSSFGNLTNLVFLRMSNDGLTDSIPSSLGRLTILQEIHLDSNQLSGRIPAALGQINNLGVLNLSYNKLSDSIPSSLGSLRGLSRIFLDHNAFTGSIPASFGENTNGFRQLYFNDNQLSGHVPMHIGQFDEYQWLNTGFPAPVVILSNNRFIFSGLEDVATNYSKVYNILIKDSVYKTQLPTLEYTPQAIVPLAHAANTISISVGSTVSRDTFRLYHDGVLAATQVNDSTFSVDASGNYFITVTNETVTKPSVKGQNLVLCSDTVALSFDTSILPAKPAVVYANREFTGNSGWTNYYFDNNTPNDINDDTLLLSLQKHGQYIGTIGDGTFAVKLEATAQAGSNTGIQLTNPLITNPTGFWVMNRYWQVTPTKQPTGSIGVRFYYNAQDLNDVNGSYPTHNLTNNQLIFYKSIGGSPDPTSNLSSATRIISILPGVSASDTTWTYHQLSDTTQYAEFSVASFSGGGGGGTGNGQALPVKLLSFIASQNETANLLQWTTVTETNSSHFVIERSTNGAQFTPNGTVNAKGNGNTNTSYSFVDNQLFSGITYYRLRLIDKNGTFTYSETKSLTRALRFAAAIYPNPVKGSLAIHFTSDISRQVTISITTAEGKPLLTKEVQLPSGASLQVLPVASLSNGICFLKCTSGKNEIKLRFVKQ